MAELGRERKRDREKERKSERAGEWSKREGESGERREEIPLIFLFCSVEFSSPTSDNNKNYDYDDDGNNSKIIMIIMITNNQYHHHHRCFTISIIMIYLLIGHCINTG